MSLFQELKRRNVFRVAVAYLVTSWLMLQLADVVLNNISAPEWVFRAIMLVLAIGFVLALLLAWAFEMTPEGLKKERDVDRTQSITHVTGRKLDRTIIAMLAVGLIYFFWESRFAVDEDAGAHQITPVVQTPAEQTAAPDPVPAAAPRKSIAVLPFSTRSNVEDDRFFSDGMHDDLLTQLAKIGDLKVISRTSVMEYRDTTKNLRQIGIELGVSSILEGAIQRAGEQVRINVQLIDAQTDEHLWAEIYDRELTTSNLFAIQSEIARAITEALQATLSPEEEQRLEQRSLTDNLEALKAYQRSRLLGENFDVDNLDRAKSEILHALELDPGFAVAWAQLAFIHMALYWHVEIKPDYLTTALAAIEKGRALAPDLPELDIAEGFYYYWGFRDYENAIRVLTPVLETYPNNADVHKLLGWVMRRNGQFEASLEHLIKALALEPRSAETASSLSDSYLLLRNEEKAWEYLKMLEAIDSNHQRFYFQSGSLEYVLNGDPAAALRYWEHVYGELPFDVWRAQMAVGDYTSFVHYEYFNDSQELGEVRFTPALMQGLTLRLAGNPAAASPFLEEARAHYVALLSDRPDDFRQLMPLCLVAGARNDAEAASDFCSRSLQQLPKDAYDRNYHRQRIAAGFALAGLNEQALELVEGILQEPAGPTGIELQLDAMLSSLHEEPGWKAVMGSSQ